MVHVEENTEMVESNSIILEGYLTMKRNHTMLITHTSWKKALKFVNARP